MMKNTSIILIWFVFSMFSIPGNAESKYLLMPDHASESETAFLPHPLFGEAPDVQKNTYYSVQEDTAFRVAFRVSAKSNFFGKGTAVTFLIKNLDPSNTVTINPVLDFIDSTDQVRPVMNLRQIMGALQSEASQKFESGSFFAYGDPKFVSNALGGYAIGSLIGSLATSSRASRAAKTAQMIETYWLKDEYRIPPGTQVGAIVLLNGIPPLPLKARVTIGGQVFEFVSVQTESEAEKNLDKDLSETKSNAS